MNNLITSAILNKAYMCSLAKSSRTLVQDLSANPFLEASNRVQYSSSGGGRTWSIPYRGVWPGKVTNKTPVCETLVSNIQEYTVLKSGTLSAVFQKVLTSARIVDTDGVFRSFTVEKAYMCFNRSIRCLVMSLQVIHRVYLQSIPHALTRRLWYLAFVFKARLETELVCS